MVRLGTRCRGEDGGRFVSAGGGGEAGGGGGGGGNLGAPGRGDVGAFFDTRGDLGAVVRALGEDGGSLGGGGGASVDAGGGGGGGDATSKDGGGGGVGGLSDLPADVRRDEIAFELEPAFDRWRSVCSVLALRLELLANAIDIGVLVASSTGRNSACRSLPSPPFAPLSRLLAFSCNSAFSLTGDLVPGLTAIRGRAILTGDLFSAILASGPGSVGGGGGGVGGRLGGFGAVALCVSDGPVGAAGKSAGAEDDPAIIPGSAYCPG